MDDAANVAICSYEHSATWFSHSFYKGAIGSIRGGLANMDVLVSTGTLAIYLYSVFMLFYHQSMGHDGASHVYFEASVMVIGFC